MKINVIGKGPGWQDAPKRHEDGLCFGINDHILKRDFDYIFDMHPLESRLAGPDLEGFKLRSNARIRKSLDRAKELNCTVISIDEFDGCLRYPIEKIVSKFNSNFFGSGFDYAFAYAMYLRATQIDTYGIALMHTTEYVEQKHTAAFWVGLARGMGIKVNLHGICEILKLRRRYVYGYKIKQSKFMTEHLTRAAN